MVNTTIGALLKEKGPAIYSIEPSATVHDAIAIMAEKDIAAVLVIANGSLVGIISAKDFGKRVVLQGHSANDVRVHEVMTSPVLTVNPNSTVVECIGIMTRCHIRHLPVLSNGDLLGVVTLGDLARALISDQAFEIDQLMTYVGRS